jgi:hypothetical protein
VRAILQEPHLRVYFAGEHLDDEQGFLEGAVVTRQDAAQAVLKVASSNLLEQSKHPAIASHPQTRRNAFAR